MQKHHNIEFLRIAFSIIIVYFHILHSNIMKYVDGNIDYIMLARLSDNAGWIVECFFVMSGYFLYQGIVEEKKQHNISSFVIKKVFRLGPVLWFSILLGMLFFKQSVYPSVFNSVFLQCVGLSLDYKGINWFVSPLFWGLVFFYCLLRPPVNLRQKLFGGAIVYFAYLLNIQYCHGGFGRETVYGVLNLGLARALAGIGLGCIIYITIDRMQYLQCSMNNKLKVMIFSSLEFLTSIFLIGYFLFGLKYKNNFIVVIAFSVLFMCFIIKKGIISQFFNKPYFSYFGRYGYSIYVMQQICFWILQKTLWKSPIIYKPMVCVLLSLSFSVVIGVLTYHFIEKPGYQWYRKHIKNNYYDNGCDKSRCLQD